MRSKLVYLTFLMTAIMMSCINQKEPKGADLGAGDKVPNFSCTLTDGTTLTSKEFQTDKWLICFFNTTCPDCQKELPILQEFYNLQLTIDNSQLVNIICIAREQTKESIEKYWKENNLTLPYSPQEDRKIYNLFATLGIPQIYYIEDGTIICKWDDKDMPNLNNLQLTINN